MNITRNAILIGIGMILLSGCAQKVQIKALSPAKVGAMASKKKVAVVKFKNDSVGLSSKIESQISKQRLDKKRYFTVLSRTDMAKILKEQKIQSSDGMDESTASKVGKLIGAQVLVSGEITAANTESDSYEESREKCISYYKEGGCAQYKHYKVTCKTTQANVSASINIIDVENGTIIYADAITKDYSGDSCKAGQTSLGLLVLDTGPKQILSKQQALSRLTNSIANEFVYKLTPKYIYFKVGILDSIELKNVTDEQEKQLEVSLKYVKAGRLEKAENILTKLLTELNDKSYVVAYDLGVVFEARGKFNEAKAIYTLADELTVEPVGEINLAVNRIQKLIEQRDEAQKQMAAQ